MVLYTMLHMKYVLTGGPGFGKTAIIAELSRRGYNTSPELYDTFIASEIANGGKRLPWIDRHACDDAVLPHRIEAFYAAPTEGCTFFDRGIADYLGFCAVNDVRPQAHWVAAAEACRYDGVFVTPPWPDIFVSNAVRHETYQKAIRTHEAILEGYRRLRYRPIEIPHLPIEQRADYVLGLVL